jgi:hypothetical protein
VCLFPIEQCICICIYFFLSFIQIIYFMVFFFFNVVINKIEWEGFSFRAILQKISLILIISIRLESVGSDRLYKYFSTKCQNRDSYSLSLVRSFKIKKFILITKILFQYFIFYMKFDLSFNKSNSI